MWFVYTLHVAMTAELLHEYSSKWIGYHLLNCWNLNLKVLMGSCIKVYNTLFAKIFSCYCTRDNMNNTPKHAHLYLLSMPHPVLHSYLSITSRTWLRWLLYVWPTGLLPFASIPLHLKLIKWFIVYQWGGV